jgi:hypothetical protein
MKPNSKIIALVLLTIFTGVFWRHSDTLELALLFFVRPVLIGFTIALILRRDTWGLRILSALGVIAVMQFISAISYGLSVGWRYILHDGETQLFIAIEFGAGLILSVLSVSLVGLFFYIKSRKVLCAIGN